MALTPGQVIDGKYRIERQLGVGGMGAVYEGENVRIHRKVAIKVLHAAVATKADIVQRFEREAQAAGRIGSKHIVEVLDLGNLPDGDRFMVMEYLDGESLGDRLKRIHRFQPHDLAPILVQVLEGLAAAHEAGIVHRDLKPDNVYLLKSKSPKDGEFVKILDFGVSKFSSADENMAMTNAGAVMGTPYYLSPEQARGGTVDARSDVYAMGVVAYQLIAGVVPFHADNFNELLFKIALDTPRPLVQAAPGADPHFAAIVERAMAREPGARFQSAGDMRDAMSAWMQQRGIAPGPVRAPGFTANPRASTPGFSQSGSPLGQSGAPLGQSGAPFGQSGAPAGQSGQWAAALPPHGQSGAQLGQSAGGLSRTGAPFGQSGAPLGQSGAPLGQSGAPLGQSGAPLGQSGALGQSGSPLGQSGAGRPQTPYAPQMPYGNGQAQAGTLGQSGGALGQSGSPLGQSGSPLGQSGSPLGQSGGPMGQSSVALAVTPPRASTSPVVLLVVVAICFVGGGIGGLGWYFMSGKSPTPTTATSAPTAEPRETPSATPTTEPSTATSAPADVPSAAPSTSAAAAPASASAAPLATPPSASAQPPVATPPKPPPAAPPKPPPATPPKPPPATPPKPPPATPPKPPPASTGGGRSISGNL